MLLERLGAAIIDLQRIDLPMAGHVHHLQHIGAMRQGSVIAV